MPAAYLAMKQNMIRQKMAKGMSRSKAIESGTKEASMTWNKKMAGTGKTVGRGRN